MRGAALADRPSRLVDDAVSRLDGWRSPMTGVATESGSYKEWMHFCVRLPGDPPGHLLVNFNATERRLSNGQVRTPRVIVMCDAGGWRGEVQAFADADVTCAPGRVDARMGGNHLRWRDGAFEVQVTAAELSARPADPSARPAHGDEQRLASALATPCTGS